MTTRTRLAVDLTVILICAGLLAWFTVAYVAAQQRKICGLIVLFDGEYERTPPQTETGRRVAAAMHDYRLRIGC